MREREGVFDKNIFIPYTYMDFYYQGDSGGPLLYQLPNKRWITIGVVSWGIRCGEDRPAVYTKVSKYLNWIIKNSAL